MRTPRMSPAQVRFMDEYAPAYLAWMEACGHAIGIKFEPWMRRTIEAMIRKDFITPDGHITDAGKKAWTKEVEKSERLIGYKSSFVVLDDLHKS